MKIVLRLYYYSKIFVRSESFVIIVSRILLGNWADFLRENVKSFPFASSRSLQNDALSNKIVTTSLNFNIEKSRKDENKKKFLRIMVGRFELVLK